MRALTSRTFGRVTALALVLALAACGKDDAAKPGAESAAADAPATPAPAGQSWQTVFAATPEGGFRIGNPDAKVKLVEFASLTCPHCKDFHAEAAETIRNKYVASGNVSFEYRNFVLNGPDYAVTMLARCQGPEAFFGLLDAFYADQTVWLEPFTKMTPADQARLQALPQDKQIAALAEMGQLDAYVRARGIPRAKFDQCLADPAALKQIEALRKQATDTYKLTGTPGFIINGQTQDGVFTWADLEPKLKAALR
ncbi:MAG: protein-disulfide isomerase [Alphaproteobacteria bacterium PA4]|nr:MAG: protein-disulfide isomerase [Alphaproteobacteria bacterium PA4]